MRAPGTAELPYGAVRGWDDRASLHRSDLDGIRTRVLLLDRELLHQLSYEAMESFRGVEPR